MDQRNHLACDQCHQHKLKCIPLAQGCARCSRLGFNCTFDRVKLKRGRKPAVSIPPQGFPKNDHIPDYPVLKCLSFQDDRGAAKSMYNLSDKDTLPISRMMASALLEHFYESPEKDQFPQLFCCQYSKYQGLSCYMPTARPCAELLGASASEFIAIRRGLLAQLMERYHKMTLPDKVLSLDDGITAYHVTSIGPNEEAIHSNLPYYVSLLNHIVQSLHLNHEVDGMPEEEKEERRRLWWVTYIVDRHSSLSLNLRPRFTDLECQDLLVPCSNSIWAGAEPLPDPQLGAAGARVFQHKVMCLDVLGILVPLFRIAGEILEYHFLRTHTTFNKITDIQYKVRESIQQSLDRWLDSFRAIAPPHFIESATQPPSQNLGPAAFPIVGYYGLHLYHSMHVLLYGQMDLVRMYEDSEWQGSPDFIKAGEHAMACANITKSIITIDTHFHFFYRLFGTYLVQSSFIFLILAHKLGAQSDALILDNCGVTLHILDIFVANSNMSYQRDFARALRRTLGRIVRAGEERDGQEPLDPELLRYRWIAGYSGLWRPSNRPGEGL